MLTRALASQASPGLVNDLYQLTMAYGYWASGVAERRACFHLFFREPPFRGAYAVAAGLEDAVALLEQVRFGPEDTAYLATLTGTDGEPLFSPSFLQALEGFELRCDVDAIPEGTVVFGRQPLLRVTGPIWQCQLLETPLLNCLEFATLVVTKATRVVEAAGGPGRRPRRLYRRLCRDQSRLGRAPARNSRAGHPRPQLGHVL